MSIAHSRALSVALIAVLLPFSACAAGSGVVSSGGENTHDGRGGANPAFAKALDAYRIVWDSPSANATGSMPLGGGNLNLNVWVEGDDLLFYIAHPDSHIEDQKLVKLGRVRLSLSSSPFRRNFRQELDLAESCIRITGDGVALKLWVDAFQPVVHVEMQSETPVTANLAYESWRFEAQPVADGLEWCYRIDPKKDIRQAVINYQKAGAIADKVPNPSKNLTMGGRLVAKGLVADGTGAGTYMQTPFKSWKSKTAAPVTKLDLQVLLRVAQDDSVEAWRTELDKLQHAPADRAKTLAWWREFWSRSFIVVNPGAKPEDPAWQVGRNYQLFRYMLAANRTGKFPTLFNGGLHTFDNPRPDRSHGPSPDERAWGFCLFMGQNQRLLYWPMLKSGDFDMLDVGLDFYRDLAPLAQAKAKHFLGVEGTLFQEGIDIFGLLAASVSGNGLHGMSHLSYHFTSSLEFAYMMAEECRFTGRDPKDSLPVMMGMLKFYDSFYQQQFLKDSGKPLDANGKLVIYPGNACEAGVGCRNHADAIAGLMAITDDLLELPGTDRAWLESFRRRIPAIPTEEKNGRRVVKMAESWERINNLEEFPQIYTVFPFHRYGVGLPDYDLARDTWRSGTAVQKLEHCWKQGNIVTADLGLADEAQAYALKKFLYPWKGAAYAPFKARFPAFWVTYPFDAFPDMDHGGCAMIGLQEMLLQTPGDRLLLLPGWQADWDVHFKLHAPKNTTVECEVKAGKIVKLEVSPASRRKDVEIIGPVPPPPRPVSQGKPATASSVYPHPSYTPAKAFDGDPTTRWSAASGSEGWLEVDLGEPTAVARAVIVEKSYPQTAAFTVEAQNADGAWKTLAEGTTLGEFRELKFAPVTARKFRLRILKSNLVAPGAAVTIDEFQLYAK